MVQQPLRLLHEHLETGIQHPPTTLTPPTPEMPKRNGLSYAAIASLADLGYVPEGDFRGEPCQVCKDQCSSQPGFPSLDFPESPDQHFPQLKALSAAESLMKM